MIFPRAMLMALFSLSHSVISKTQLGFEGKTAARALYIIRPKAATWIHEQRTGMALDRPSTIKKFCAARESMAGRNGRIAESIILALPREAEHGQRICLIEAFAERLTKGIAPYLMAIHDGHGDSDNPHAHLLLFDQAQDRKPGQRGRGKNIIGLSRNGALEKLRADWAQVHNFMMGSWGFGRDSMVDHRSLADQGVDRLPTLHEGAKLQSLIAKGQKPQSETTTGRNGREIRWSEIDEGLTRVETNALVREFNQLSTKYREVFHEKPGRAKKPRNRLHDPFPGVSSAKRSDDFWGSRSPSPSCEPPGRTGAKQGPESHAVGAGDRTYEGDRGWDVRTAFGDAKGIQEPAADDLRVEGCRSTLHRNSDWRGRSRSRPRGLYQPAGLRRHIAHFRARLNEFLVSVARARHDTVNFFSKVDWGSVKAAATWRRPKWPSERKLPREPRQRQITR